MIAKFVGWYVGRKLKSILNSLLARLQSKVDVPMLCVTIKRYQDGVRRWYFAVDAILSSLLKKCEDGIITDDEAEAIKTEGLAFVNDVKGALR